MTPTDLVALVEQTVRVMVAVEMKLDAFRLEHAELTAEQRQLQAEIKESRQVLMQLSDYLSEEQAVRHEGAKEAARQKARLEGAQALSQAKEATALAEKKALRNKRIGQAGTVLASVVPLLIAWLAGWLGVDIPDIPDIPALPDLTPVLP